MRSRSILAVDLGTTRLKCGILSDLGDMTLAYSAPAPLAHPEPGAAIQDPQQVLDLCIAGLQRCAALATQPEALVLTGQMGGVIVVDRHGAPLTPWVTNLDSRAQPAARALQREIGARVRCLTASAPEQAPLLRWLREGRLLQAGSHLALLLAPYLATRLAREGLAAAYCDHTCLGWSGLADVVAQRWDDDLVRAAGWSLDALPPIVTPGAIVGHLAPAVAERTGLAAGLPIIAGPGDQAASIYGLGGAAPGAVADSASTFPLLVGVTRRFFVPRNAAVEVMPGAVPGTWHPLAGLRGSGGMAVWYADQLAGATLDTLEGEAAEAGNAAGIIAVPYGALSDGSGGRGIMWGIGPGHRRGHLYRAILEGLACEYGLLAESLAAEDVNLKAPLLSYGGASTSPLLARLKAAVLGMAVRSLGAVELTVAGAALLGAHRCGWTVELALPQGEVVEPTAADIQTYRALLRTYRELRENLVALSTSAV